jgi:Tetratricopeptide repeat
LVAPFDRYAEWQYISGQVRELCDRGDEFADNQALEEAICICRSALTLVSRERVLDWAATQNHLGRALWTLGARESGTARLEEAVATFCQALKEITCERVPIWAAIQSNLGNALAALGERESGTARLEEAVAAFREALKQQTRARVPLDWAVTENNLGAALKMLGEREPGIARLTNLATRSVPCFVPGEGQSPAWYSVRPSGDKVEAAVVTTSSPLSRNTWRVSAASAAAGPVTIAALSVRLCLGTVFSPRLCSRGKKRT